MVHSFPQLKTRDRVAQKTAEQVFLRNSFIRHSLVVPFAQRVNGIHGLRYLLRRDKQLANKIRLIIRKRFQKLPQLCKKGVYGRYCVTQSRGADRFAERKRVCKDNFLIQLLLEQKWRSENVGGSPVSRLKVIIKPLTREFDEPEHFSFYLNVASKLALANIWSSIEAKYADEIAEELSGAGLIQESMQQEYSRMIEIINYCTERKNVVLTACALEFYKRLKKSLPLSEKQGEERIELLALMQDTRERCLESSDWRREEVYRVHKFLMRDEHQFNEVFYLLYNHAIRLVRCEANHLQRVLKFLAIYSRLVLQGIENRHFQQEVTETDFLTIHDDNDIEFAFFHSQYEEMNLQDSLKRIELLDISECDPQLLTKVKNAEDEQLAR